MCIENIKVCRCYTHSLHHDRNHNFNTLFHKTGHKSKTINNIFNYNSLAIHKMHYLQQKQIAIYCVENKFAEDRRKIKRFPLASKLRTIASGNQVAFLCELLVIASACTFPAVTWYFCFFCLY